MRQIEKKMIEFLDAKIENNGLAQLAIEKKDARTLMLEAAKMCVGIREKTNHNDGPMVELIQETIGGHNNEAWCMAFVQTCIAYAEVKTGIKSLLPATEHCMTLWRNTDPKLRVKILPLPGAVIIWQHAGSDDGHTGFVLGADNTVFTAVEGNTTFGFNKESKKIVREGGGVYFTQRSMQNFPKVNSTEEMRIVGFLKPF